MANQRDLTSISIKAPLDTKQRFTQLAKADRRSLSSWLLIAAEEKAEKIEQQQSTGGSHE